MTIPKGATVMLEGDARGRRGKVLREVAPHIVRTLDGEQEKTKRYEVYWPDGGEGAPETKQVHLEYQLKVISRDSRFP